MSLRPSTSKRRVRVLANQPCIHYAAYADDLDDRILARLRIPFEVVASGHIEGYRLTFRTIATLEVDPTSIVPVVVYRIPETHLPDLDKHNWYRPDGRVDRVPLTVQLPMDQETEAYVYIPTRWDRPIAPPNLWLYKDICDGYLMHRLDRHYLYDSIDRCPHTDDSENLLSDLRAQKPLPEPEPKIERDPNNPFA